MNEKAKELYSFIQERYLWQFYSRSWDRDENIKEIFGYLPKLYAGEKPTVPEVAKDKAFYAESVTVANETKAKFSWIAQTEKNQLQKILDEVKEKLIDVNITKSQNGELHIPFY